MDSDDIDGAEFEEVAADRAELEREVGTDSDAESGVLSHAAHNNENQVHFLFMHVCVVDVVATNRALFQMDVPCALDTNLNQDIGDIEILMEKDWYPDWWSAIERFFFCSSYLGYGPSKKYISENTTEVKHVSADKASLI